MTTYHVTVVNHLLCDTKEYDIKDETPAKASEQAFQKAKKDFRAVDWMLEVIECKEAEQ